MKKNEHENKSIRDHLISVNIYQASLPTIALAFILMFTSTLFSITLIFEHTDDIISAIESSTASYLGRYISSLDEVYQSLYQIEKEQVQLKKALDAYNMSNPQIENIWILDDEGHSIAGSPLKESEIGRDYSGYEYFKTLVKEGDVYWSDVFISHGENRPIVTIAKKYSDVIVVLRINLGTLTDVLNIFTITDHSYIAVIDSSGAYMAHSDYSFVNTRGHDPNQIFLAERERGYLVYNDRYMMASYRVITDTRWGIIYYQSIMDLLIPILMIFISGFIFVLLIGYRSLRAITGLNNEITSDLTELVRWTNKVAEGDYGIEIIPRSFDEFNKLYESFKLMIEGVLQREAQLEDSREKITATNENLESIVEERTQALKESLENLRKTQNKLIQKEKMAALGSMVSGVAHELNTPIGIAVTTASYMARNNIELKGLLRSSKLNRGVLEEYIDVIDESSQIILRNMDHASELIKSFKKVAIDQQKMDCKEIDLEEIIDATFKSYSVEMRKNQVVQSIKYAGDLKCNTYPGAISQVLINLIQNSLLHAFNEESEPQIGLECIEKPDEQQILMVYWDNGTGIHSDNVGKIYDPFYTTALGTGGSGLGMNIVYNLVTGLLEGEIAYVEHDNKGACFEIKFPKKVKH